MKKIKRKIMPCLDLRDGKVVKGVNFTNIREMGDPVDLAQKYEAAGADELVLLDISKTLDKHDFNLEIIKEIAAKITIPLTVGGGIASIEDIRRLVEAGASSVSIASAALINPDLIKEAAGIFGSEKITVAFDIQADDKSKEYYIYTHAGSKKTEYEALMTLKKFDDLGAGRFLITGIGFDGSKKGFDVDFFRKAEKVTNKPLIASGGAGKTEDFVALFRETSVEFALAASIFHQDLVDISDLKKALKEKGILVKERDRFMLKPDFKKNNGLLSVILQDHNTKQLLMNGFMNEEAYQLTLRDDVVWFYSRTRKGLWKKGESSGNIHHVVDMNLDCDQDALLISVKPDGPTCHLGTISCFDDDYFNFEILEKTIQNRITKPKEGSYTKYLIEEGMDKILKKCGEEMTETIIACKNDHKEEIIAEASDLFYHLTLLLNVNNVTLMDIKEKLAERHGEKQNYSQRKKIKKW